MAREMKDSGIEWIGSIPKEWEVRKVKHYYQLQTGFTPDTKNETYYDDENGFDWVNISDINDGKTITKTKKKISQLYVEQFSPEQIPEGSLMYSFKLSVGQTAFAGKQLYSNEAIASFLPSPETNLRFLRYSSFMIMENAEVNIYNARILNRDRINNAYIVFPPLAEQKRIADFLDIECARIDEVIEQTRASIEEYKKLKQAVITEAVTKGIRPDQPMKDSGIEWIGEIPADWICSRFKYIAQVKANLVSPYEYGDYPQVSPENIEKGSGKLLPCRIVSEVGVISGNHLFHEGQILYSKIRPKLNKVTIAPFEGLCSADMYPIETLQNTRYILYSMLSNILLAQVSMITEDRVKMPKINQDELGNTWFVKPPLQDQEQIVDYLDSKCHEIDELISTKEQLLVQIQDLKKSIIYEYVTGKKEV